MKNLLLAFLIFLGIAGCNPKEITWVAIGDSITYLNEYPEQTGNRVEKGYLTRVTEKLPEITYVNQGHNGWTAGGIAEKFDELEVEKGDIYSVFLGTNDWWQGRPIGEMADFRNNTGYETIYGSFRIIIDKIRGVNPRAKIVLLTPLQRGDFVYIARSTNNAYGSYKKKNGQSLSEVAEAVLSIGETENIPVIDLYHDSGIVQENMVKYKRLKDPETGEYRNYSYPDFIDIPFDPENDEYPYPADAVDMTYDGLHPSDAGNEVIAEMVVEKFSAFRKL